MMLVMDTLLICSEAQKTPARRDRKHGSLLSRPISRDLRVCNAYTSKGSLKLLHEGDKSVKVDLTEGALLPYKSCRDFTVQLDVGHSVQFKIGGRILGVFRVQAVPHEDAVLLLVAHRRRADSATLQFASHVYASLLNAQIAVLDTYQGDQGNAAAGTIEIKKGHGENSSANTTHVEKLAYNTVVALNPGNYECLLAGTRGSASTAPLVALNRESYVVMRVGQDGESQFPEELLIFPSPSFATRQGFVGVFFALLIGILHT